MSDLLSAFLWLGERERKSQFSSCKFPSLGKAGEDPVPQTPEEWSSRQGSAKEPRQGHLVQKKIRHTNR